MAEALNIDENVLLDENAEFVMKAIQDAYWVVKKKNRKYMPAMYRRRKIDE